MYFHRVKKRMRIWMYTEEQQMQFHRTLILWTCLHQMCIRDRWSAWRRWNFSGIISSHSLKTADIDCIVYDVTTATCLTRMFADKTTGGREWIVLTDQADRICVTSFSDKSDISRNIYMCRAQR